MEHNGSKKAKTKVGGKTGYSEISLTLDTNIYASGEILSDTIPVYNALDESEGTGIIHSITLLDKDDQAGALDLVFLRTNVSLGTKNAAMNFSDTIADEILGIVQITTADYVDLINSQIVTKTNLGIGFQGELAANNSIFVAAISRDAKTYTANGITLKITILQD
jgi:hypothetical protein